MKSVFVVAAAGLAQAAQPPPHRQTLTVSLSNYPGATPDAGVGGFLTVETSNDALEMKGYVTGLEASETGGIHIHAGFSCQEAAKVGGHWYNTNTLTKEQDPWTTNWNSDAKGVAEPTVTVNTDKLGFSAQLAVGRTVVVHDKNGTKVACGVLKPLKGKLVRLGAYPGMTGMQKGLLSVTDMQNAEGHWGISVVGTVVGMPADLMNKGWHIHTGFSCENQSAVGDHYWEAPMTTDPWVPALFNSTFDVSGMGVAHVSQWFKDFHVHASPNDVIYRTVVFHGEGAARLLCGTIGEAMHATTVMTPYPGYGTDGVNYSVNGTLVVTVNKDEVNIKGYVFGLPASGGGIHIHSGYSCASADLVGGHWWKAGIDDPWTTTYSSMPDGTSEINVTVSAAALGLNPMLSVAHTVVIHDTKGTRIACGVLEPLNGRVAWMKKYPNTTETTKGLIVLDDSGSNLRMRGTVMGLLKTGSSNSAGFHIHAGYSCEAGAAVGDHYYVGSNATTDDDWNPIKYRSDGNGVAQIHQLMSGYHVHSSITSANRLSVADRTMVAHGADPDRMGCAVIGGQTNMAVADMGVYPGYVHTGDAVQGTVVARVSKDEVHLSGVIFNLPPSTTGGFHIHAGYSCAVAENVGAHWWAPPKEDPWTTTMYTSDAKGVAVLDITVTALQLGLNPMWAVAHTLVAHNGMAKIGCGLLKPFAGKIAHFGTAGFLAVGPHYQSGVTVTGALVSTNGTKRLNLGEAYNCEDPNSASENILQYSGDNGVSQVTSLLSNEHFENWMYRTVTTDDASISSSCAMINSQMNTFHQPAAATTTAAPGTTAAAGGKTATSNAFAAAPVLSLLAALACL